MISQNRFIGCFLGLAVGDTYGAVYEGGMLERTLWRIVGTDAEGHKRYTDDTQMSIDTAESFLENGSIDQDALARRFAASYRWSRGYGPGAAKLLKGIARGGDWRELNRKRYKEGSMGNGAAMRAPIVALCHPRDDGTLHDMVVKTSEITHAHPLAIEGACLIALAVCYALEDISATVDRLIERATSNSYKEQLQTCKDFLQSTEEIPLAKIKAEFGNGILATRSVVTALYFALRYREKPVEEMLGVIAKLGGDTDTIGAMAGAIWGAYNGAAPLEHLAEKMEDHEYIIALSQRLFEYNYR